MVANAETVNGVLSSYVADVTREMPIAKAYLFGSYAKGTPHKDSDLDVCFFSDYFEDKWVIDVGVELLRLAEKYNRIIEIEPHTFATSELNDGNPFIEEILWNNGGNGTDDFGFNALPGGDTSISADNKRSFGVVGNYGYWWTDTEDQICREMYGGVDLCVYVLFMTYYYGNVSETRGIAFTGTGYSVRCIKN